MTTIIIAENLLAQLDEKGHRHLLIDEIEDHRVDDSSVPMSERTYTT